MMSTIDAGESGDFLSMNLSISSNVENIVSSSSQVTIPGNTDDSSCSSKKNKSKKKSAKRKIEPANAFLQFIKAKKSALRAANPENLNISLNMVEARKEWKGLEGDQKTVYTEMFKKEKDSLGDDYRKNRSKKNEVVVISKPKKRQHQKKRKVTKAAKELKVSFVDKISVLMKILKEVETQISERDEELIKLKSIKQLRDVQLAVGKTRMKIQSENAASLKEKLANLTKLHKHCNT